MSILAVLTKLMEDLLNRNAGAERSEDLFVFDLLAFLVATKLLPPR
jgi:hypothetical protein